MFKLGITGTRSDLYTPKLYKFIEYSLAFVTWLEDPILLVHGDAKGVDTFAKNIWNSWGREDKAFPYPSELGKAGGGVRNQEMVDFGLDLLLAFPSPDSRGTWDCVTRASKAGIKYFVIRNKDEFHEFYNYVLEQHGNP